MNTQETEVGPVLDCVGYRKLVASVEGDEKRWPSDKRPRESLHWAVARAQHYADKTGLTPESILDAWEAQRDYWHVNFYQEANQPAIIGDRVRVFETQADLLASVGKPEFRCPACGGVSKSPYTCDSGKKVSGKVCDWKSWGLFGCVGKGVSVFVKEKVRVETFFMPVAWESGEAKA